MLVINNKLYLNELLEPMLVSIDSKNKEYFVKNIDGKVHYQITSNGYARKSNTSILDIEVFNLFDCNDVCITNNFEVIYANEERDFFTRNDIHYGLRKVTIDFDDSRFAKDSISNKTPISRFKNDSNINTKLIDKYYALRKAINRR